MTKKVAEFIILTMTVLLILLVPVLIESGMIPVGNKILAYSLIFIFMVIVSFAVSFVFKKYEQAKLGKSKRDLYDSLVMDYTSDRIAYNLARSGINRHMIALKEEKNKLEIEIKKGFYTIAFTVTPRSANLNIDYPFEEFSKLDSDTKDRISKEIFNATGNPNSLITKNNKEVYEMLIGLYKAL